MLKKQTNQRFKSLRAFLRFLCIIDKSESEVAQSCPTLWDPVDYSPPCSPVHGIFQARVLEWVAISFSRDRIQVSCIVKQDALPSEPPGKSLSQIRTTLKTTLKNFMFYISYVYTYMVLYQVWTMYLNSQSLRKHFSKLVKYFKNLKKIIYISNLKLTHI